MASLLLFCQEFWEIVKYDVIHVVGDFIKMGKLLKEINKTFIFLITKTEDPQRLRDLRPISLCNTIYKVLAKVMVNCIKALLEKFIGPYQNGFVLGWKILNAFITTHEVIHCMEKSKIPGMALEIDISKAYDKVRQDFLFAILARLGFSEKVSRIIKNVVTFVNFSVLVNGTHGKFLSSS
jgi:hypothetical protein